MGIGVDEITTFDLANDVQTRTEELRIKVPPNVHFGYGGA